MRPALDGMGTAGAVSLTGTAMPGRGSGERTCRYPATD